jgi:hypothetical protein
MKLKKDLEKINKELTGMSRNEFFSAEGVRKLKTPNRCECAWMMLERKTVPDDPFLRFSALSLLNLAVCLEEGEHATEHHKKAREKLGKI